MTFQKASPMLARALNERDYQNPTPVQAAVLRPEAEGRDILVSAQTGSGKTVAFGLAMSAELIGAGEKIADVAGPLALVIAPTRELALQVARELQWLYQYAGARIVSCVGGMDQRTERRALQQGAHIVVGTPGRLRDHIERHAFDPSHLQAVVLDEADEMLDMGFREDLEFILDATPDSRRTLMFSATMPKSIAALAKKYQRNALRIEAAGEAASHADIEYRAVRVDPRETEKAVVNLLRFYDSPTAIVFCNTRDSVRHLQAILQERGFAAALLSGELSQHERNLSMAALRDGRARVCVATDVAARGLDLPTVGLVIHADLPHDAEALQHRSGRTGRAGRKGVSVLLVPPKARRRAENLIAQAHVEVEWAAPPTAEEIKQLDRRRILQDADLGDESSEDDSELASLLLSELGPDKIAAALARILRARLPTAEEVADPGFESEKRGARDFPPGKSAKSHKEPMPGAVWFRLDIGRSKNADPKWILPMLCRKGGVNRADIGAIRIFPNETNVEIAGGAASGFLQSMRRPGGDKIGVERLGAENNEAAPPPKPKKKPKKP
ncbi:DEAD/DEAH box helicase [Rhodoblastus sp.]|uniref:DEAD/DEAH box helicase n=2 Tax=Rhodoblastus sp. TaxID=1962975 RepID=UPI003F960590